MNKAKFFLILFLLGFLVVGVSTYLMTAGQTVGQVFFGRQFAESQLRNYVQKVLNQELNGGSCQAVDSDGNGYVSCDYTTQSEPNRPRSVECAAWGWEGFFNRGCKSRQLTIP